MALPLTDQRPRTCFWKVYSEGRLLPVPPASFMPSHAYIQSLLTMETYILLTHSFTGPLTQAQA